ncbi:hypothetical protein HII31_02247 [Pseudocercospora fuligena]|uniref:Uncharacterized protein n=1 Tax=Pseudocercospora fuligena TaxID=685502 RepID=A0A8H6RSQ7_9PEZI|nr:hypothetical protein HII31_02247 [Pseudocercospora fuligena]
MYSISSKQASSKPNPGARPFGKLRINTQFTSSGSIASESRVPELSFVSFEESKARKNATTEKQSLRQRLGGLTPISIGPRQAVPQVRGSTGSVRSRKGAIVAFSQVEQQALVPPTGKRTRGLRPKPLDLNQDVSPSDRAIPIGISVSPSTISNNTTPQSILSWDHSPAQVQGTDASRYNHDSRVVNTPMIVITPAKDRFSPQDQTHMNDIRPASSIYSRYTNCYTKAHTTATPPVPPLPLFASDHNLQSRFSDFTRNSATIIFEDAAPSTVAHQDADFQFKRSTAGLPTPRRSRGWWNIITSPFSAKSSGHGTFFWRSPSTSEHDVEREPVLQHAAEMAHIDSHSGAVFLNRASDDDSLRSAPAEFSHVADSQNVGRHLPTRSVTAPGALDANAPKLNIYTIPKTGEAASYYGPNRNFPSLYLSGNRDISGDLQGWSPSQSVFIQGHSPTLSPSRMTHTPTVMEAALEAEEAFEVEQRNLPRAPSTPLSRAVMFSTPSAEELKTPPSIMKFHERREPQNTNTMESVSSPLSATPKIQDAHVAQFVTLQRKTETESAPVERKLGLAAATMAHSDEESQPEKPALRPAHIRQDSHGLGITSEQELLPPPVHLREKPRLGTDRFGQLTIRSGEDEFSARPWYRRFFWLLATSFGIALLILVVLPVVFIPQHHSDMAVQAAWLNLTGFPAIVVGISTVIQAQKTRDTNTCVSPSALWSCAAPGLSSDSMPEFRLEIRFRNGTLPHNETELAPATTNHVKRWQDGSRMHRFIKRNSWSSSLYSANPSPPSEADQNFLGQTTDNVTEPYNGIETPFYLSLLDTATIPESKLRKRDSDWTYPYPDRSDQESSAKNASTSAANEVPSAASKSNGEPTKQTLYPLVSAQPLRLYNLGQDSEHYGFYSYFDRTIYTSGSGDMSQVNNNTSTAGNVALSNASAVCTFSQTRLLVQIWTKKGTVTSLNASGPEIVASNSSANDMSAPGSFPLPITITIDRHGGVADKKGVYCYGLDEEHRVMSNVKTWINENRGSSLINAAAVPGSDETSLRKRGEVQGIDGGSGGCDCQYQNWS